jgi:hypothetical protein
MCDDFYKQDIDIKRAIDILKEGIGDTEVAVDGQTEFNFLTNETDFHEKIQTNILNVIANGIKEMGQYLSKCKPEFFHFILISH